MSKTAHVIYIVLLACIVAAVTLLVIRYGLGYYQLGIEERFFHPGHADLKPSGLLGHGYGIIGSLLMIIGVSLYMARKRVRSFRFGLVKHWLELHIFLCTLGPVLVLFHTSFKFGGLVAISFWSMVAVFLSGIIGRFIYLQIPRTIEGREMSLQEVVQLQQGLGEEVGRELGLGPESRLTVGEMKRLLEEKKITGSQRKHILALTRRTQSLSRRINRLEQMQNLFKYWHVAHLPFALVMLVIMVIHVVVTILFGYRWIL